MKTTKTTKKAMFFWTLFHLIGYSSFLTGITPSIELKKSNGDVNRSFIITPEYSNQVIQSTDMFGHSELMKNMMFPDCSNCEYNEQDNFWPFHDFTYGVYNGSETRGFVGIWGYYGHSEFLFYMCLPLLILICIWIYRKFINNWIKEDAKNDNPKESLKNDELTYPQNSISLETQIEKYKIQKELISKAFEENLLTFEEYNDKLSKININLDLIYLEEFHLKRVKKLELENHSLFESLNDLFGNDLISLDEYKSKKEIIINKLLLNNTNSNVDSQYNESLNHKESIRDIGNINKKKTEREMIIGVSILSIMALVLIITLLYLNKVI
jgi:hypothetical protein